ncbi:hypothetical protein HPP92_001811 [Vanilla planifolia]|uniref:Uncharacterized protein n=1 Tax=Vanilla planifolia TaxID=51239 RepID=A0A835RRC5_VANPL|nr:hypothetical protein HPP92_001811 [Vanilla planifolia]
MADKVEFTTEVEGGIEALWHSWPRQNLGGGCHNLRVDSEADATELVEDFKNVCLKYQKAVLRRPTPDARQKEKPLRNFS